MKVSNLEKWRQQRAIGMMIGLHPGTADDQTDDAVMHKTLLRVVRRFPATTAMPGIQDELKRAWRRESAHIREIHAREAAR